MTLNKQNTSAGKDFLDMYFNPKHVHIFEKNNQFYIQGKTQGQLQGQPQLLITYIKENFGQ